MECGGRGEGGAVTGLPNMAPVIGETCCPLERGGLYQRGMTPPVRLRSAVNFVAIDGECVAEGTSAVEGGHLTRWRGDTPRADTPGDESTAGQPDEGACNGGSPVARLSAAASSTTGFFSMTPSALTPSVLTVSQANQAMIAAP